VPVPEGPAGSQCPGVDLYSTATQEDWYPVYDRLRIEAPAYRIPGSRMFVLTRYDDVLHALRHQEVFTTGSLTFRHEAARRVYEERGWPRVTPLSVNPPEHRQYRALVDEFFDANGARRYEPLLTRTIAELLDHIVARGRSEFVTEFALPLPVAVITAVLGFPAADIPQLKRWSEAWVLPFSGPLTEDQEVFVAEQGAEFQRYIHAHAQDKRTNPDDDVLSALVHARYAGDRALSDAEIVTIVDHLYIGGNETTTFALTSGLWILLREPGLYERVRDDRALVPAFVEEILRLESPTQGLYRVVAHDTEVAGVPIPAGAVVHLRYAAANRDPAMFTDPATVRLDRPNLGRHMAFSLGEHHCPGAGLSRLEQQLAFNAILDRLPGLRLAPENDFAHHPGFVLRALRELHLEFARLDDRETAMTQGVLR